MNTTNLIEHITGADCNQRRVMASIDQLDEAVNALPSDINANIKTKLLSAIHQAKLYNQSLKINLDNINRAAISATYTGTEKRKTNAHGSI